MVPHAAFKNLNWALDDESAALIEPGLVMKMEVVIKFVNLALYKDGRRAWITQVREAVSYTNEACRPSPGVMDVTPGSIETLITT